jgi:hypothetical protein
MKIVTLLFMIASVSAAHAEIYKCPGKVEGQFTYQERPCKGAKANEHTLKTVPFDPKKITEAQEKLAKDIEANKAKEGQPLATPPATTVSPTTNPPQNPPPPVNNGGANPSSGTPNANPVTVPAPPQTSYDAKPAPVVSVPTPTVTNPPSSNNSAESSN